MLKTHFTFGNGSAKNEAFIQSLIRERNCSSFIFYLISLIVEFIFNHLIVNQTSNFKTLRPTDHFQELQNIKNEIYYKIDISQIS